MKKIDGSLPGLLGAPNNPIAYAKGHDPQCFLGDGTYLRCVPGCHAQATWGQQMEAAYEEYDRDMATWREGKGWTEPAPEQPGGATKEHEHK